MKTLIRDGLVYDGRGNPPQRLDILMRDGRILAMEPSLAVEDAQAVDAKGRTVTPGFIDIHRHLDFAVFRDRAFGSLELAQGITSAVGGNCGLAPVPCGEHRTEIHRFIEPCLGPTPPDFAPETFGGYLQALESRRLPINIGSFVGSGAVKASLRGYAQGEMAPAEREKAEALIEEAMRQGALGLSMGIMYVPECYSNFDELAQMAGPCGRHGGVLVTHVRGEGDYLVSSVAEVIKVAGDAGTPLHISHFKATGVKNWNREIYGAIALIEKARASGQDVTVDFYPYTCGSTTLMSMLPPSIMRGDQDKLLVELDTPAGRRRLTDAIYRQHPGWDNTVAGIGWERIIISGVGGEAFRGLEGTSIAEAAARHGFEEPAHFVCHLLAESRGNVAVIQQSMDQEDVDAIAQLPYSLVISDALYGSGARPHPRLYGAFPKFLREYVREKKLLSMSAAIEKMTSMPAQRLNLEGRGVLEPGAWADVLIFAPESFRDEADYINPARPAIGLERAYVNGSLAWDGHLALYNGKLLTGQGQ